MDEDSGLDTKKKIRKELAVHPVLKDYASDDSLCNSIESTLNRKIKSTKNEEQEYSQVLKTTQNDLSEKMKSDSIHEKNVSKEPAKFVKTRLQRVTMSM